MEAVRELAAGPPATASLCEDEVIELYNQLRAPLLRYVLATGLSSDDGEEVIQETFLALFCHLRGGKPRQNLRAWLFRVAHNLALKQWYKRRNRLAADSIDGAAESHLAPEPNPEEILADRQRRQGLLAVFRALPERERCCLHLRAEGLRYREIAQILNMSLGAVSVALTRALAKLARADGGCK
jgi:RNA polymerase sigma-70 factor (ECF subfamily)